MRIIKRWRHGPRGGTPVAVRQWTKLLGASVLAGAVLAGLVLPAMSFAGFAVKSAVGQFDELPVDLTRNPLRQRTVLLDASGREIATVYSRDRVSVKLENISMNMRSAIVAIEDSRFYEHGAIDMRGVMRAFGRNVQSKRIVEGASTLTQQYVKNLFIEEAGDDPNKIARATQRTFSRKIRELKLAEYAEKNLGKKKILENYLNITYFGHQAYGVQAASQRYFSKSAQALTLGEAALLAGIVQAPSRFDPINNEREATLRRNVVLQRMVDVRAVSQEQADRATSEPVRLKVTRPRNGCVTAVAGAAFFCDYVRQSLLHDPVYGKTPRERADTWNRGGLTIRTTLDRRAQKSLQQAIKGRVRQEDKVAAAVTLVQPGTGRILAMGQSKPYGFGKNETAINYSVDRQYGGSHFGFPTGSTFKPFIAAAALQHGIPVTRSYEAPYSMRYPSSVRTCQAKPWRSAGERVKNEDASEVGPYAMNEAMAKSVNTYFVQLIAEVGMCPVMGMLDKLHVQQGNGTKLPQVPSIALGAKGIAPLTMASAYAAFASRGLYCPPVAIESITTMDGRKLAVARQSCTRAMPQRTADTINALLRGVIDSGTGQGTGLPGHDSAGKTGTTDHRKNAWFVGYTPKIAGAVWVGSDTQRVAMENITIGGRQWNKVTGARVPGPIWKDALTGALKGTPATRFHGVDIPEPRSRTWDYSPRRDQDAATRSPGDSATGEQRLPDNPEESPSPVCTPEACPGPSTPPPCGPGACCDAPIEPGAPDPLEGCPTTPPGPDVSPTPMPSATSSVDFPP